MALTTNDNIKNRSPKDLDDKKGIFELGKWRPYKDTAEAITRIPLSERYRGLIVNVEDSGGIKEMWLSSTDLTNFTPKSSGGSGASGGFEYIEVGINGELQLTGTARIQKAYLNIDMVTIDGMTRAPGDSGLLILEQDDTGNRQYQLKNNSNENLGSVYERNFLPRAVTVLEWYRDDRFCYWRKRDIVAGIFPTIKPVFRIDDYYDTLEMLHMLPDSQLEISIDNGPWVPYTGLINIGALTLPYGYYRGRVKPDPNRTDSPIEYSLPFFAVRKGFPYTFDFKLT